MFHRLKDLLPKSINQRGLKKTVDGSHVCHKFREIADKKWGINARRSLRPRCFKHNYLYVETSNSMWANEFYNNKLRILKQLNESLKMEIKDIIIKTGLRRKQY